MFRRKILSSVLTLGIFVGACDMTAMYSVAPRSLGIDGLGFEKLSVQFSDTKDPPPGGIKDPPNPG